MNISTSIPLARGGGGALRYQIATHCQTAGQSGSGECQNIGKVKEEKKKGGGGGDEVQTKNQIRVVTCKICLCSLYFVKYMIFMT